MSIPIKRDIMTQLVEWKNSPARKPLIVRGARQVGKTWVMQQLGRDHYAHTVYINFDTDSTMKQAFSADPSIPNLLKILQLQSKVTIDPATTLLIFDEIQECPAALTSLKYFYEQAPDYHIICAGSLLGVALHEGTSFPVGKVDTIDLFPLTFVEFVGAVKDAMFRQALESLDWGLLGMLHDEFSSLLRDYMIVGGMPEAVVTYLSTGNFHEVRSVHRNLLDAYEQDFSKHAPGKDVPKLRLIWNALPQQLAKENKKFVYGALRGGARAKDYESAMLWLSDCGLVHRVHRLTSPKLPSRAYVDPSAFKLYMVDTGLLGAMAGLDPRVLLRGDALFTEFKGAMTEQFVAQQLSALPSVRFGYWAPSGSRAELDFLIDNGVSITPMEVKATRNLNAKSLKVYIDKYRPVVALRASLATYTQGTPITDIPLWSVGLVDKFLP